MKNPLHILISLAVALTCLLPVSAQAIFVQSTKPLDLAGNVAANSTVTATFSEAPNPATLTTSSFTLTRTVGIAAVAGGGLHTLALRSDGTVAGWGSNTYGQTAIPPSLTGVVAIAAGYSHNLALKSDGSVVAWGDNRLQQTAQPGGLGTVTAISAGAYHNLVLKSDGNLVTWGDNGLGQINMPAGLSGITAIAVGWNHNLALKSDGSVIAWGDNSSGQATVPAAALSGVIAIAAGGSHSLALKSDGSVIAWGDNSSGQSTPPPSLFSVKAISAGWMHNLVINGDGSLIAWGNNNWGQSVAPSLPAVTSISAGYFHSLAIKSDGTLAAWGQNTSGQTTTPAGVTVSTVAGSVTYDDPTTTATFTPTAQLAPGSYTATVTTAVTDSLGAPLASNKVWTFDTVAAPAITLFPSTLDFGTVGLSITSAPRAVTVTNNGSQTLTISASTTGAERFDFTSPISSTTFIAPGQAASVTLSFAPNSFPAGAKSATLQITSNDPLIPTVDIPLSGTSVTSWQIFADASGNGVTTCTPRVAEGGSATCVITPAANYVLSALSDNVNGTISDLFPSVVNNRLTISNVTANHSLTASFAIPINGVCGSDAGKTTISTPVNNLCTTGSMTNFADAGAGITTNRWSWDCSGQYTGSVTPHCTSNYHPPPVATPVSPAASATGVATTIPAFTATFDQDMDPATVTSGSFTVSRKVTITKLAGGGEHSLALTSGGRVLSWGALDQTTVPLVALSGIIAISAGGFHSLALTSGGKVLAWGFNGSGQTTVPAEALSGVVAIAAGLNHSLVLTSGGKVLAWGDNYNGQATVPPEALSDVVAIAAGVAHNLALTSGGKVIAWGDNSFGETTVPVEALSGVVAIAAGQYHSLALTSGGKVIAWGGNSFGETTVPAEALSGVVAIAAGQCHSLALTSGGKVIVWGDNSYGETTVPAEALSGVTSVAAGGFHSLVLTSGGTVLVWGSNYYGEGIVPFNIHETPISGSVSYDAGTRTASFSPAAPLPPGATFAVTVNTGVKTLDGFHPLTDTTWTFSTQGGSRIAASPTTKDFGSIVVNQPAMSTAVFTRAADTATVVISNSGSAPLTASLATVGTDSSQFLVAPGGGKVLAWGYNGQGTVPAEALAGVTAIAAGENHSLALTNSGSVIAWGSNTFGQTVVPESANSGITAIAVGQSHSLALKSGGKVLAWGRNLSGQTTVPTEALTGIITIAAGTDHSLALTSGGKVLGWGVNNYGQTTVPAEALSGVITIAAGVFNSLALTSGGKVLAWGYNGQATVPVEALSGVTAIAAGSMHSLALTGGGKVIAWGDNGYGQTTVPAEALSGIIAIAAGGYHSLALTSSGKVLAWGWNFSGQTTVPAEALVGVVSVAAGASSNLALKSNGSGYACPSTTPTVAPGTACTATVTFKPTTIGAKNAALRISSNDPLAPTTDIPLSGIGRYLNITFSLGANGLALLGDTPQSVPYGGTISSVSAFPAPDYHFTDWTGNGGFVTSVTNPLPDFSAMADMAITANFTHDLVNGACGYTPLQVLAMTTPAVPCSSGQVGTISGNGWAGNPWSWLCNGQYGGTNSTSCTALIKTYSVTFNANGGTLAGSANQTVNHGANATTVSILAPGGYSLYRWTTPAGFSSTLNPLTISNVTADMPLTANFAVNAVTNLQAAYNTAAGNGTGAIHLLATSTIPAGSGVPSELIAASPVELVISGGYDASYSTKSGLSVVTGAVKVRNGKVIADGVAIRS
jgi:alpha-tubulin suppressor-like RCC1 family protein